MKKILLVVAMLMAAGCDGTQSHCGPGWKEVAHTYEGVGGSICEPAGDGGTTDAGPCNTALTCNNVQVNACADKANCGACGKVCDLTNGFCIQGQCVCQAGWSLCDKTCVEPGKPCPTACSDQGGFHFCSNIVGGQPNVCVSINDDQYCGAGCMNCLSNGQKCMNGGCQTIATCTNGVKDGSETDVDCGGSCPTKCGVSKGCSQNSDCIGNICVSGVCQPFRCPGSDIKPGAGTTKYGWWSGPIQGQAAPVTSIATDSKAFVVPTPRLDVCSVVGYNDQGAPVRPLMCRGSLVNGQLQAWESDGFIMQTGVPGCNIDANAQGTVVIYFLDTSNNRTGVSKTCTNGLCN